jgi:uncharacterized protein (DUF433 family)
VGTRRRPGIHYKSWFRDFHPSAHTPSTRGTSKKTADKARGQKAKAAMTRVNVDKLIGEVLSSQFSAGTDVAFSNMGASAGSIQSTVNDGTLTVSTFMGAQLGHTAVVVSGTVNGSGVVISNGSATTISAGTTYETFSRSPYDYNRNEPLVGTSNVSVYQVDALLGNSKSVSEVQFEFPSLSREQIKAAASYASDHPNPEAVAAYPKETLKDLVLNSGFDKLK